MKKNMVIATIVLSIFLAGSLYANVRMFSSINKLKTESENFHNKIIKMSTSSESDKEKYMQLEKKIQSENTIVTGLQNDIASFALQARICAQHHSTN